MSSGWVRCSVLVVVVPFGWKLCLSVVPKTISLAVSVFGALGLGLVAVEPELELEHPAIPSRPAVMDAAPSQVAVRRQKMVTEGFVCDASDARRSVVMHEAECCMAGKWPNPKAWSTFRSVQSHCPWLAAWREQERGTPASQVMMVFVTADREQLRTTFNSAASLYHQARPEYPAALYDELVRLARLRSGDRVLEVGCATGKATIPLARRGFRITCVELGADLAAEARRNLAGFPRVNISDGAFETWEPPQAGFALVFAATAWHWIDPAVRYRRAWELLYEGGHLAFWSATHAFPVGGDRFFRDLQETYDEIGEGLPPGAQFPAAAELPDEQAEIEATGLFTDTQIGRFGWEIEYTADEYIRLLDTFSGHLAMAQWQRDRLYGEIRRRLAERPGGRLSRGWGAVLHVARRRGTD